MQKTETQKRNKSISIPIRICSLGMRLTNNLSNNDFVPMIIRDAPAVNKNIQFTATLVLGTLASFSGPAQFSITVQKSGKRPDIFSRSLSVVLTSTIIDTIQRITPTSPLELVQSSQTIFLAQLVTSNMVLELTLKNCTS